MAKCLVTGAAGFIGCHLVQKLLEQNHQVLAFDHTPWDQNNNLFNVKSNSFEYVLGSVCDYPLFLQYISQSDQIYLLAATLGVKRVIENPISTASTQFEQVNTICKLVTPNQIVFYASTSEVYGKALQSPLTETMPLVLGEPHLARWAYACSKLLAEYMLLSLFRDKKVPVVIGRFFNVVGPKQNKAYGAVVPTLFTQALAGNNLSVFGDGNQTRSFCHVSDAINAIDSLTKTLACWGQVFNIGNSEEISINNLAVKIRNLVNPKLEIIRFPYESVMPLGFEEILHRVPSLNKIKAFTKWDCKLTLDQILEGYLTTFDS